MNGPIPVILIGCGAVSQLFYRPALLALAGGGTLRVAALVDPAMPARTILAAAFPDAQAAAALAESGRRGYFQGCSNALIQGTPLENIRAMFAER